MYKRTLILLTILQMFFSAEGSDSASNTKRVVCYYGGITGKQMKNLYPEDIDASLCTHIIYLGGAIRTEPEEVSIHHLFGMHKTEGTGYAEKLVKLKETNPKLKILLFIFPENMTWVLQTADRRTKIIQSAVALLNATGFDGLDFPAAPEEYDIEGLSTFFCEMQAEFDKYGYIVSAVTSDSLGAGSPDEIIERMSRCCSFINVLSLNGWMMSQSTNTTKHLAPITLIKTTVEKYIEKGFPANKLLISVPTFGIMVNLTDPKQTGLGASVVGPAEEGSILTDGYTIFYNTLLGRLNDTTEGWTVVQDEEFDSPYAYSKTGKWVSYENPISTAAKARYVLEKNLGGVTFFLLDMDDFDGISGKTFPLIRAVSDTFKKGVRASETST